MIENLHMSLLCPCQSQQAYSDCCARWHHGPLYLKAPNAEQLMRSRYSAYVLANAKYILDTTHPSNRHFHSKKAILKWAKENSWKKLEVVQAKDNFVTFKAYFTDNENQDQVHFEHSYFEFLAGKWYYVSGSFE